jgi:hypothetical protein
MALVVASQEAADLRPDGGRCDLTEFSHHLSGPLLAGDFARKVKQAIESPHELLLSLGGGGGIENVSG